MIIEKEIKIGWKKLKSILEDFRKAVNHNQPLSGQGIFLHDTDKGCIISTHPFTDQGSAADPGTTPDGETANWHQIQLMDKNCKVFTMWVWSGSPKLVPGQP
jgi:hypothetical protein